MLKKNQIAPEFKLPNQNGDIIKLSNFKKNKNVVLYFYPKDDTPGCTIEANQFSALADEFAKTETIVIGVSKDSSDSHQAFIDKFNLNVMLLADIQGELCQSYNVCPEKNPTKATHIIRSTFIINKEGVLIDVEYKVNAEGHAQAVLEKIQHLIT